MAQLTFTEVINLTTSSNNSQPKLVNNLMIGNEPNNDIWQYYGLNEHVNDKHGVTAPRYADVTFDIPTSYLTSQAVTRFGIKTFPGVGAIGFYTRLGSVSSKLLAPIHIEHRSKYVAPTLTVSVTSTKFTFTFVDPSNITYSCHRLLLRQGNTTKEYITYFDTIELDRSDFYGTFDAFGIGYVDEGQSVSEDSNILRVTGTKSSPDGNDHGTYTIAEVDSKIAALRRLIETYHPEE